MSLDGKAGSLHNQQKTDQKGNLLFAPYAITTENDNDGEITDSSSIPDDELVGCDVESEGSCDLTYPVDRDIDDESDSDSSVFENGDACGGAGYKVFKRASNVGAGNPCNFRKVES